MYSEQLSQGLAVVSCIDPDAYAAGTYNGDGVDMSKFNRAMFVFMAGDLGASATMDGKLQGSADNSTFADLSGKAMTQFTQAGSDGDKQAVIEITAEELHGYSSTYRYVRPVLVIATATSDAGVLGLAGCPRIHPASDDDLASVDEIVT